LAQSGGNSLLVHHQSLPWGNADLSKTAEGMNVRFVLHQQPKLPAVDSIASTLQVPSYSCFVQIPAGNKVALQIQRHTSHHVTANTLSDPMLLKLAKNTSAPLVQLQGYRWFRGKRLAQLNISMYTNTAQSLEAIDTIGVALKYKSSPVSNKAPINTSGDKQFKSVFNTLVLHADETITQVSEPLQWADSTKNWLPQNGKAIKLTIPNDGIYRIYGLNLTALAPELSSVDPGTFRLFNKG
jgi:hypothetical protein